MKLEEAAVRRYLQSDGVCVRTEETVDSTNLRLKEAALAGRACAPCLLIADGQTAGRGRLGRGFVSPPGDGLYMSMLLDFPPGAAPGQITLLAAVAVCRAIEATTSLTPKIKWVNDVFARGKKVCGILAEGVGKWVIVGIGVNVRTPPGGFPPEAGIAGALDQQVDRAELAGRIGAYLLEGMKRLGDPGIAEEYRRRMPLVGRTVTFEKNGEKRSARVTGVRDDGALLVASERGEEALQSGEISLSSQSFSGLE